MIFLKQKRFNEFLNSIEEINPKTLSIGLKELERDRLIKREIFNETPVRIEYYVTEKGKALLPILEQMALFSMQYCCEQVFENLTSQRLIKLLQNLLENIQSPYRFTIIMLESYRFAINH